VPLQHGCKLPARLQPGCSTPPITSGLLSKAVLLSALKQLKQGVITMKTQTQKNQAAAERFGLTADEINQLRKALAPADDSAPLSKSVYGFILFKEFCDEHPESRIVRFEINKQMEVFSMLLYGEI
jgi:hypothetical protein